MSGKTHKGMRKRMKRSATGKLFRRPSGKRHLMSSKPARKVRRLGGWRQISKPDLKSLKRQFGKI